MAKKVRAVVTLQIPAGKANPAPPVGTALGPHGINIMDFVKSYNERTAGQDGQIIPAPPGTILLARPGMRDRFIWDPLRPTRHGVCKGLQGRVGVQVQGVDAGPQRMHCSDLGRRLAQAQGV